MRELGAGGMATVYLADDLRHDEPFYANGRKMNVDPGQPEVPGGADGQAMGYDGDADTGNGAQLRGAEGEIKAMMWREKAACATGLPRDVSRVRIPG